MIYWADIPNKTIDIYLVFVPLTGHYLIGHCQKWQRNEAELGATSKPFQQAGQSCSSAYLSLYFLAFVNAYELWSFLLGEFCLCICSYLYFCLLYLYSLSIFTFEFGTTTSKPVRQTGHSCSSAHLSLYLRFYAFLMYLKHMLILACFLLSEFCLCSYLYFCFGVSVPIDSHLSLELLHPNLFSRQAILAHLHICLCVCVFMRL